MHEVEDCRIGIGAKVAKGHVAECQIVVSLTQQAVVDGLALCAFVVVVGILPIHGACQFLLDDVLTLDGQRAVVVVAVGKLIVAVRHIGNLGHVVPMVGPLAAGDTVLYLLQGNLAACAAIAVESQTHHQLAGRDACLQVVLNGL